MVVFVDLEGDEDELQDIQESLSHALTSQHLQKLRTLDVQSEYPSAVDCAPSDPDRRSSYTAEGPSLNINGFSAALSCYP